MRDKRTGAAAAQDPDSPINRALAAWDCDIPEGLKPEHVSEGIRAVKITKSKGGSEARKAPARKNPAATPEILERHKLPNGGAIRLQKRGTKFDVLINSTGIAWYYLSKGVGESHARATLEMWLLGAKNPAKSRGVKYINEARADKKDDPSWIGYAVQKATGGGAYAIFEKKTEAVDYARELANKMGRQMAVVRYRYKVQQ